MKRSLIINIIIVIVFIVTASLLGIFITSVINPSLIDKSGYNKVDIIYGTWRGNINNGAYSKVEISEDRIIFYSIYANGEEKRCGQMTYTIQSQSSDGSIILLETGVRNGSKIKLSLYEKDNSKLVWKNVLSNTDKGSVITREEESYGK